MIEEREILEAMLNSTSDQCRAAGELFLALADRPRDIHFKADLQRRLDSLPPAPSTSIATHLEAARHRAIKRDDELWRIGWHPIQLLSELKRVGYDGIDGVRSPAADRLLEMHDDVAEVGLTDLAGDVATLAPNCTD